MKRRQFIRSSATLAAAVSLSSVDTERLFAASLQADITDFTANELSQAIRQGSVSCTEVMQAYLDHIHRYNPVYNAIVSMVDDDELFSQAREADRALARGEYRGWMHGMPHAVKDLAAVKGMRHTEGSLIFADRIADSDSDLAARLRAEGAIFIGKTNAPEFGSGSQTYNPIFGATGSACNPALTAGGSSGGAASALGTRMVPVADGGDMLGSLRNPAAFNNVVSFRPSTNGQSASGPLARNTADMVRLLQTMAANPIGPVDVPARLQDLRIGWLGNFNGYLPMEPGIIGLCESGLAALSGAGAEVDATTPHFDMSDLWFSQRTIRAALRSSMQDYYDDPAIRPLIKPEMIWEIEQSLALTEQDLATARELHDDWRRELDRLFGIYDLLVLPSCQVFPFPKEIHWPQEIDGKPMDNYIRWMEVMASVTMSGSPTVTVPVGFDASGRCMGMQVFGPSGEDQKVLEFALAYEHVTDYPQQRPTLVGSRS